MDIHNINDFDKVITSVVHEMESKHNCWIWILSDESNWYINVCYIEDQRIEQEVKMCPIGSKKYEMARAIRKHFSK